MAIDRDDAPRALGRPDQPSCGTRPQRALPGDSLYVLDEPTTGLHPADVAKLMAQLDGLVAAGNTVIIDEHEMHVVVGSDRVIDIGPGAGDEGGRVVAAGLPTKVAAAAHSRTAPYLARFLATAQGTRRRLS